MRAAVAAGALGYLVKPFAPAELAARLAGYARYRQILTRDPLRPEDIDAALEALRPRAAAQQNTTAAPSPTKTLVLQALATAGAPMSAAEVAAAIGGSRATAQRYLAALASAKEVEVGLRYGATGRPEQEFAIASVAG